MRSAEGLSNRDLAELTTFLLIPMAAALIRTQQGHRQIARRFGRASLGRQFLLGCAIVVLPAYEMGSVAAVSANDTPTSAWLLAGAIDLVDLGPIMLALAR